MNARGPNTDAFVGPMLPAIDVLTPPISGSLVRAFMRTWKVEHVPTAELIGLDVDSLDLLNAHVLKQQNDINRVFDQIRFHGKEPRKWPEAGQSRRQAIPRPEIAQSVTAPITTRSTGEQIIAQAEITGQALSPGELRKVTNHDLMVMVFGRYERLDRPIVAAFMGNPKEDANWRPYPWWPDITLDMPGANLYLTLATYSPMRGTNRSDSYYARRDKHCASVHGFLCDDVRDWHGLALLPTWVIETSAGNYQAVYLLDRSLSSEELRIAAMVQHGLVDKGLSDPGAMSPTTRFMRLPVAVNGKHAPPFRCRLVHLNPAARYSVAELRDGLGLDYRPVQPFQPPKPLAQLAGEMAEVQRLVTLIDVQHMDRAQWIAFMHALRGATQFDPEAGLAMAIEASWHHSPVEIEETIRVFKTIDVTDLRSGVEELRRMAGERPHPTKVFEDLDASGAAPTSAATGNAVAGSTTATHAADTDAAPASRWPRPYRGAMADIVVAMLASAPKPREGLAVVTALVGMAAACNGRFRLAKDGNSRLNLYTTVLLETGEGKEHSLRVAEAIALAAGALTGKPASGEALEDMLEDRRSLLLCIDEAGHLLAVMNQRNAPPHLTSLGAVMMQLHSRGSSRYHVRTRAATGKAGIELRTVEYPTVSALMFSTPQKFGQAAGGMDVESGALGRHLFYINTNRVEQRRMATPFNLPESVTRIARQIQTIGAFDDTGETTTSDASLTTPFDTKHEIDIEYGPNTDCALEAVLARFNARQKQPAVSPLEQMLATRGYENMLRVAGTLAVWDDPSKPILQPVHVAWAETFILSSIHDAVLFANEHMREAGVLANAEKVLNVCRRILAGELKCDRTAEIEAVRHRVVPRREALKHSGIAVAMFDKAMEHLEAVEAVACIEAHLPSGATCSGIELQSA